MIIIPVRTDRQLQHTPWVNYLLIAANVLIYTATSGAGDHAKAPYLLLPTAPSVYQFITYQFLHASPYHLAGNMLFLYIFGNSVEDRLGKIGYLCFYLAGGVIAGLGHALLEPNPVLGASGSIAAVTGAYLALFPKSVVTLFYWVILFIGFFEISSMLLILFRVAQDAFMFIADSGSVAYLAHLSGYAYGLLIGMGLLWFRFLPREPYDLLSMLEHRRRRAQFSRMTRQGSQPREFGKPGELAEEAKPESISSEQRELMELRSQINNAVRQQRVGSAAELYEQLLALDADQVMSQQTQLDLANQLMSENRYDAAATAYELFLKSYGMYPQREQVELILGLVYARYLSKKERARELLSAALPRLRDPGQKALALQTINEASE